MTDTNNLKSFDQLSQEIGEWAAKNFDTNISDIGALEELGELAHCIAKREQGIRGYDNPEKFMADYSDAVADIGVYLLHYSHSRQIFINVEIIGDKDKANHRLNLAECAKSIAVLLRSDDKDLQYLNVIRALDASANLAALEGLNFLAEVNKTWDKVSQRDWRKNKVDADAVVDLESATDEVLIAESITLTKQIEDNPNSTQDGALARLNRINEILLDRSNKNQNAPTPQATSPEAAAVDSNTADETARNVAAGVVQAAIVTMIVSRAIALTAF